MTKEMKLTINRWEESPVSVVAEDIAHAMVYFAAKIAGPPTGDYLHQMALAWNSIAERKRREFR